MWLGLIFLILDPRNKVNMRTDNVWKVFFTVMKYKTLCINQWAYFNKYIAHILRLLLGDLSVFDSLLTCYTEHDMRI